MNPPSPQLNSTQLNSTQLNSTELNWTELNWTELNWTELNWTELNWTQLNWTELNWTELNWTELNSLSFSFSFSLVDNAQLTCMMQDNMKTSGGQFNSLKNGHRRGLQWGWGLPPALAQDGWWWEVRWRHHWRLCILMVWQSQLLMLISIVLYMPSARIQHWRLYVTTVPLSWRKGVMSSRRGAPLTDFNTWQKQSMEQSMM